MNPDERERLVRVEIGQDELRRDQTSLRAWVEKTVADTLDSNKNLVRGIVALAMAAVIAVIKVRVLP